MRVYHRTIGVFLFRVKSCDFMRQPLQSFEGVLRGIPNLLENCADVLRKQILNIRSISFGRVENIRVALVTFHR